MGPRLELQKKLESVLENFVAKGDWKWNPFNFEKDSVPEGWATQRVHFQPPPTFKMEYPCVVYSLDGINDLKADNIGYHRNHRWTVTVIDRNPDSKIPEAFLDLPYCTMERPYTADNLHHFPFTLYY